MKSKLFLLALCFLLPLKLSAGIFGCGDNDCCENIQGDCCSKFAFQIRGAAFLPSNHFNRELFHDALATLQLEGSYSLFDNVFMCSDQILLWANVSWTPSNGDAVFLDYKTRLNLLPISLGLEYEFNLCQDLDFYVGAGVSASYLSIRDRDGFMRQKFDRWHAGGVSKAGFRYFFCDCWFADVFVDYYYSRYKELDDLPITIADRSWGGLFVGGGLGLKF